MMISKNKAIIICGKLCCGKTSYANCLLKKERAVLLSCDEISLALFDERLGEKHSEVMKKVQGYLYKKSLEIIGAGTSVILDWGFWRRADRDYAKDFYGKGGAACELHYLCVSKERLLKNIEARNKQIVERNAVAYYVDEGLCQKAEETFEEPSEEEIDLLIK